MKNDEEVCLSSSKAAKSEVKQDGEKSAEHKRYEMFS